jgi:hypothetical protein
MATCQQRARDHAERIWGTTEGKLKSWEHRFGALLVQWIARVLSQRLRQNKRARPATSEQKSGKLDSPADNLGSLIRSCHGATPIAKLLPVLPAFITTSAQMKHILEEHPINARRSGDFCYQPL